MGKKIIFSKEDTEAIVDLYVNKKWSMRKLGPHFGCSPDTIKRVLIEQGIKTRPSNEDKFKEGMLIGPYNILLVEKINDYKTTGGKCSKNSYGKFLCPNHPENDPHYFIAKNTFVQTGKRKQCPECAQKQWKESYKQFKKEQRIDYTGQHHGKLTYLEILEGERANDGGYVWLCKCDCGNYCEISSTKVGKTKSCGCLRSAGEAKIANILEYLNINFEKQKYFNNCINPKTNAKLYFDFYLPDYNCCIEYDGEQHFEGHQRGYFEGKHKDISYRDNIKNQYCKNNSIKLIRIPYFDYDKLSIKYIKEKLK